MIRKVRSSIMFCMAGGGLIVGGMSLQNFFEYAPAVGWFGGFTSFIVALAIASQRENNRVHENMK